MITTFRDVIWKGKSLLDCKITRDMNNEEVIAVLVKEIENIEKEIDLSQVKIKDLGIVDACKLQYKNMLTEILNALIAKDMSFAQLLSDIQKQVNNFQATKDTDTDEKVKVNATDTTAGYLVDKVVSPQKGSVKVVGNQLSLMGFAPVGAVMMIDNGRIGDFDATGKGKVDTDVWGWAISNGQNGTRNRLGKFPRFIGALADAGNTGGANTTIIGKENISSFDMAVSGSINEALPNDINLKFKTDYAMFSDGPGGGTAIVKLGGGLAGSKEVAILPFNIKHSHTFTLKASHSNPNPSQLNIVPEYIYEIPIQRINV
jgi:hypothetical protein